jgi:hypothetical protein
MATIDSLCILVEIEEVVLHIAIEDLNNTFQTKKVVVVKRVIRSYEGRGRAEEDMELLQMAAPGAHFRIDPIAHIER